MDAELSRIFGYTNKFYLERLGLIIIFSVPFIISSLLLALVAAPTYNAIGGAFLRTGSIPELSLIDILFTAFAYILSVFIVADTIVNVNIIVRAKRTLTSIRHEVITALSKYATRIFYIYTMMLLLLFISQLLLYEHPLQPIIYPIIGLALSFLLFYVAPAVVIDNSDTPTAIRRSAAAALRNPSMVILWTLIGLLSLSVVHTISIMILPGLFGTYLTLLVNSLFVLPYLIILQTQMYMEKYPLAR
ncbi:hypothetical protein JXA56_04050 [Candidatus Micrarchaeota archaeon]|nr:hypothetical protein [Candidatus Micrarchaeota archaeon]